MKQMLDNRGQTLLEALIALTILVIILGAVATAVLTSINNSSFIKQQNQANKLAQQGLEYVRDRINNSGGTAFKTYLNYAGLLGSTGTQCFNDLNATTVFTFGPCSAANVQGIFKREATFTSASCNTTGNDFANGLNVTVNVYWSSGKCPISNTFCHRQKVSSCFIDPAQNVPAGGSTGI